LHALLDEAVTDQALRIRVASDRQARERAYRLAYGEYERCAYVSPNPSGLNVSWYDREPSTLTLLAEDDAGRGLGTITLVFDSARGLPCDDIYRRETDELRERAARLVEFTRLAVREDVPDARRLLLNLFNRCYIFSRFVRGHTHLLAEVNPRHVPYYRRMLLFDVVGPLRHCPRVQQAPAVLLALPLARIESAVKGSGCRHGRDATGRRLHAYPYSREEEQTIARSLARRHRPMTREEARHFGLASWI
jgi:hypothetical protein